MVYSILVRKVTILPTCKTETNDFYKFDIDITNVEKINTSVLMYKENVVISLFNLL